MEQRVRSLLEEHYPGARIELETARATRKVGGYIIWDGFEGQEFIDRQQGLFDLLRAELGPDAQRLSLIFTYTPKEYRAMEAA